MKKVFALVAVVAALMVAGKANAQLSVNGGFMTNFDNPTYKYTDLSGKEVKNDTLYNSGFGVWAGVSYNIDFSEHWGIAPGVYVNYVGDIDKTKAATTTVDMVDMNIPILFNYKKEFTSSFGIRGFVGPNIRYGVMAKSQVESTVTNTNVKTNLYKKPSGADHAPLTRTDLGLTIGVGVHFNAFQIQTGFNFGLLDRNPGKNVTLNMHQYFVGVGYVF